MKQGKRLNYTAKRILSAMGENVENWLIKIEDSHKLVFINKKTGELKEVEK